MKFLNITKEKEKYRNQLIEIFWETSAKKRGTFSSIKRENNFFHLYFEDYFSYGFTYIAVIGSEVVGYLLVADDTNKLIKKNEELGETYKEFFNELKSHPASLHININPAFQGLGVGRFLIESVLKAKKLIYQPYKIHLITHIKSSNVLFYKKLRFKNLKTASCGRVLLGLTYF